MIPITRRASHSTRCTPFFCVRTPLWRSCLTQIPQISLISLWVGNLTEADLLVGWLTRISRISLISLWVGNLTEADLVVGCLTRIPQISLISLWKGNLTEVGGVLGCMGFPIHRVLRVLRVLYSLCLPRLNSYS